MEKLHLFVLAAIIAVLTFAASGHKSLTNYSRHEIRHVYVAAANESQWSGDQLDGDALLHGDSITLSHVRCGGEYFIKAVDADGRQYVMKQTNSCRSELDWTITDEELLASTQPVRLTQAGPRSDRESGSR